MAAQHVTSEQPGRSLRRKNTLSQRSLPLLLASSLLSMLFSLIRASFLSRALGRADQQARQLSRQLQEQYKIQEIQAQQLQDLQDEVKQLTLTTDIVTDAITGLPNYHALISRIDAEISRCRRTQCSCALLFIGLDSLKSISDTWGLEATSTILRETAERLQENTRAEDFAGYYGDENFVLLLVETDLAGAIQSAERLRELIVSHPYRCFLNGTETVTSLSVTTSIGIAAYGMHGDTGETLLRHGSVAMYSARQSGRNHTRIADINEIEPPPLTEMHCGAGEEQSTINALTAAASAHHMETGKHAHRMVSLAEATAKELGCSEQELHLVRLSTLLHDIGKIGIPDAILDKPGPLSLEEWEVMRLHPQIGQRILRQAGGIFATLAHIIVAHHERWDGQGYPLGLSQYDIPIEARILSVVDSFDAMTSQRVYRQPATIEEARAELLRCGGSQFDPEVVLAFLHVLDRSTVSAETALQDIAQSSIPVM